MKNEIDFWSRKADESLEVKNVDETTTYYFGFCESRTRERTEAKWSIMRVTEETTTVEGVIRTWYSRKWANGSQMRKLQFSECENYEYTYRNF